ncbi:MAG: peptide MFS transporter [Acidobacteriota bacterium]|nr:MAG: peptide MFS transporter [Acidobacteriota bacterium]
MAFGHPKGLFPLFFTEMWERLAFYTMVGILLLYTTDTERGGLGLPSEVGNEIYGLYLAFVYFTPFIGGMIADRFLGYRRAVALGGLLMAAGLILMGMPGFTFFVFGLIGLIVGNGFFKPNISVMVGNLYKPGDPKRDTGFNIFYMGINIGALLATLVLAPLVRNSYGWLWTFRAAGFGVLIAVLILLWQWRRLEAADRQPERSPEDTSFGEILLKILVPAFVVGVIGWYLAETFEFTLIRPAVCGFLAGMIPVLIFFIRLGVTANEEEKPGLLALLPIFVAGGAFFMILHLNGSAMTQWARDETDRRPYGPGAVVTGMLGSQQDAYPSYYVNASEEVPRPDPRSLLVVDDDKIARMYGQQRMDESSVSAVAAIPGVEVEEVGGSDGDDDGAPAAWRALASSVYADGVVSVVETVDSHGVPTVSVSVPDGAQRLRRVAFLREVEGQRVPVFITDRHLFGQIYDGYRERFNKDPQLLPPGQYLTVINPEVYQSWNPFFVIILTPLVVWFFTWRVNMNKAVPTAHKLLYGMLLTTASLLIMALAGVFTRGGTVKVSDLWLAGFYVIVTLGELCLSPMGLSLVTKLSPKRLVGLTMGGWFLATAFGNNLSGFFGGIQHKMDPMYFFLVLAGLSALVALFILLVLPRLDRAIRKYGA